VRVDNTRRTECALGVLTLLLLLSLFAMLLLFSCDAALGPAYAWVPAFVFDLRRGARVVIRYGRGGKYERVAQLTEDFDRTGTQLKVRKWLGTRWGEPTHISAADVKRLPSAGDLLRLAREEEEAERAERGAQ
jgi:hypothetical protein